jgi:parallel beta-helix repeat protein
MLAILGVSFITRSLLFNAFDFYKTFKPKYAKNIFIKGEIKMKKPILTLILALLLASFTTLTFNIQLSTAKTIIVPNDYPTIQQAINAANPGDTIIVYPGTYPEQILISGKSNLTIVAMDSTNTIIQGEENATVVRIYSSNNINFNSFIIRGTGYTYPQPSELLRQLFPWSVGILVEQSINVRLENNTVIKNLSGVILSNSKNVTMRNNHICDNVYNFGVNGYHLSDYLHDIDASNFSNEKRIYYEVNQSNIVIDSAVYSDIGYLGLINSQNITVKNLNVSNNFQGVLLAYTANSSIENIQAYFNLFGLQLLNSKENIVRNNKVSKNTLGILLLSSGNNTMRANNITNNTFNFGVLGFSKPYYSDYVQDIDTSNTVNGKPIYYWVDQHNREIPPDAGYVAAVHSTNITVKDLTLSNNIQGVLFADTLFSKIKNVIVSDNLIGVNFCAHGNILSQSLISRNLMGIWLIEGQNNTIIGNVISSNYGDGISFSGGAKNTIIGNSICNNSRGVYLLESYDQYVIGNTISYNNQAIVAGYWSRGNIIYHNNFINNTQQAITEPGSFASIWDNGYPSGGNYWSDYTGVDKFSGPYQNETGSDGIGDTPYVIKKNEKDNYPLMNPWVPEDITPPTIGTPSRIPDGDVFPDQEVTISVNVTDAISGVKNVTLFYTTNNGDTWTSLPMNYNSASGSYMATIPGQPAGTLVRYKIVAYDHAGNNATIDGTEAYCIYQVIPEFPQNPILILLMLTTLITTTLWKTKRKHQPP